MIWQITHWENFWSFFRLFFDKSDSKIRHWSCPVWGNWCNNCSIYYLPFVFSTHWSNRNQACSVFKLVLSRFSNLMNIISKTNWVKSYCLIKKPEYKFSFSFVNSFLKTKQTNKKQKKKLYSPVPNNRCILHFLHFLANLINLLRPLQLTDFLIRY